MKLNCKTVTLTTCIVLTPALTLGIIAILADCDGYINFCNIKDVHIHVHLHTLFPSREICYYNFNT